MLGTPTNVTARMSVETTACATRDTAQRASRPARACMMHAGPRDAWSVAVMSSITSSISWPSSRRYPASTGWRTNSTGWGIESSVATTDEAIGCYAMRVNTCGMMIVGNMIDVAESTLDIATATVVDTPIAIGMGCESITTMCSPCMGAAGIGRRSRSPVDTRRRRENVEQTQGLGRGVLRKPPGLFRGTLARSLDRAKRA